MSKVLIIEDEFNTAKPVQEALALIGIDADIAKDGMEGINRFKNGDYDLVLLDLRMPGMSGEEVLKEIRNIDPFMEVIIYTNYTDFEDIKRLANLGIEGYINKGPNADLGELLFQIQARLAPLNPKQIDALLNDVPQDGE